MKKWVITHVDDGYVSSHDKLNDARWNIKYMKEDKVTFSRTSGGAYADYRFGYNIEHRSLTPEEQEQENRNQQQIAELRKNNECNLI